MNIIFLKKISILIFLSYIFASACNSLISVFLISQNTSLRSFQNKKITSDESIVDNSNFLTLEKTILNRNIFNITGEIPQEDKENMQKVTPDFETVPCSNAKDNKLPVELIGIIYTGNQNTNLVIFKDSHAESADIYKQGQALFDNEGYEIYKITGPTALEMRHGNIKICLSLDPDSDSAEMSTSEGIAQNSDQTYELNTEFVSEQIGEGFSKILNSARLIPESVDGKTIGFKITSISPDSLFAKIDLENGDVITHVNGIDLEDSSQGFKLYEAFQDEATVSLKIKRLGKEITKKVTIR